MKADQGLEGVFKRNNRSAPFARKRSGDIFSLMAGQSVFEAAWLIRFAIWIYRHWD